MTLGIKWDPDMGTLCPAHCVHDYSVSFPSNKALVHGIGILGYYDPNCGPVRKDTAEPTMPSYTPSKALVVYFI